MNNATTLARRQRMARPATKADARPVPLSLSKAGLLWESTLSAERKSPKTARVYLYALNAAIGVLGDVPIESVKRSDVERVLSTLRAEGKADSTVMLVFGGLRACFRWAVGHPDLPVTASPLDGMASPKVQERPVETPRAEEVRRLLATCLGRSRWNFRGIRDAALIRVMASTGLRLAEVTNLTIDDIDLDTPYPTARVVGKGDRVRFVPLDEPTVVALRLYVEQERPRSSQATLTDALWLSGERGPLSDSGVAQMVRQRSGGRLHPHQLRHFAIHSMLEAGMQENAVMQVSGHRTQAMLLRYGATLRAERADRAFREAKRVEL